MRTHFVIHRTESGDVHGAHLQKYLITLSFALTCILLGKTASTSAFDIGVDVIV